MLTLKKLQEQINKLETKVYALEQILEFEMKKIKIWQELYKRPNDTITFTAINIDKAETILSCQKKGKQND